MKYLIKLLKDWKVGDKTYTADMTIEVEKDVAAGLVLDGIGTRVEKADDNSDAERIEKAVKSALDKHGDEIADKAAAKIHAIQTKDLSDEDPFHGFLPGYNGSKDGHEVSKDRKLFAFGNFAKAVHDAGPNLSNAGDVLKKSVQRSKDMVQKAAGTGMVVSQDDSAGALIPPELSNMLMGMSDETAVIEPKCARLSIATNRIELPHPIDYTRSGGLVHGGVVAYFKGEDAQLTESRPKMEDIAVNLHALTVLAYASDQSIKFSAIDMGSYLMPRMAAGLTFKKEQKFLHGTGSGMPLGILNAKSIVEVAKATNQTAATIVWQNITDMEQRLKVENGASVMWLYNRNSSLSALRRMFLAAGTGGITQPAFQGNPFSNNATLDSVPISHTEHCEAIGTVGDIILSDFSQYLVVTHKSGIEVASSIHLKFDYLQTAWRMVTYIGGQPIPSKVYTSAKSITTAPVITLAVRS